MPCLKTASCFCSHGGHREPHFYFLKVFPILSVLIFMIKLLHKHRDLISLIKTNGQAKYVWVLCGRQETLRLAFSLHFSRLIPQNLVIYLDSQACSLPYGLSVFFFKHSFLWTLFFFYFLVLCVLLCCHGDGNYQHQLFCWPFSIFIHLTLKVKRSWTAILWRACHCF